MSKVTCFILTLLLTAVISGCSYKTTKNQNNKFKIVNIEVVNRKIVSVYDTQIVEKPPECMLFSGFAFGLLGGVLCLPYEITDHLTYQEIIKEDELLYRMTTDDGQIVYVKKDRFDISSIDKTLPFYFRRDSVLFHCEESKSDCVE